MSPQKLFFVISYLLEDEQELSFGMLDTCRGDDLWGMPRAELSAGWHPRSLHGSRMRRPALPEGPAVPAAGW
jgi:hypothetical protein